jgi:hypothetical protein
MRLTALGLLVSVTNVFGVSASTEFRRRGCRQRSQLQGESEESSIDELLANFPVSGSFPDRNYGEAEINISSGASFLEDGPRQPRHLRSHNTQRPRENHDFSRHKDESPHSHVKPTVWSTEEKAKRGHLVDILRGSMEKCACVKKFETMSLKSSLSKDSISTEALHAAVKKLTDLVELQGDRMLPLIFCQDIVKNHLLLLELPSWNDYASGKEDLLIQTTLVSLMAQHEVRIDPDLETMLADEKIISSSWQVRKALESSMFPVLLPPGYGNIPRFLARCIGLTHPTIYLHHLLASIVVDAPNKLLDTLLQEYMHTHKIDDFGDIDWIRTSMSGFVKDQRIADESRFSALDQGEFYMEVLVA